MKRPSEIIHYQMLVRHLREQRSGKVEIRPAFGTVKTDRIIQSVYIQSNKKSHNSG